MFEIKAKDGLGRIGKLKINKKSIETPTLMPVINPNKIVIAPKDMADYGAEIIITNSYIIYRTNKLKETALEKGIHKMLDFNGVIETDSGSFQMAAYGDIEIENKEILQFQKDIGVDIGTFLDIPTHPDSSYQKTLSDLEITLERAREAVEFDLNLNGTVQGGTHLDLRKKSAAEMSNLPFTVNPIGGVVPLMMEYRFSDLVDVILTVKGTLSPARPVHLFGAGHPMLLSLSVLLGCDLFDSAAYVLYAQDSRYLTSYGTKKLNEMKYLPCNCPVCRKYTPQELINESETKRLELLSSHNLYATFEELKIIKEAIHEGTLFELVETRIRSHPRLLLAYRKIKDYYSLLEEYDPITKRSALFYTGEESNFRPIVRRTKERTKDLTSKIYEDHLFFGKYPKELEFTYPFGQCEMEEERKEKGDPDLTDENTIMVIADYQFGIGVGEKLFHDAVIKRSKTKMIRYVYDQNGTMIATLRARDGLFTPNIEGSKRLKEIIPFPKNRIVVDDEAAPFIKEGANVFSKFVLDMDNTLRAYEEVLIVNSKDDLLGTGTLMLSPREIKAFERGMAVRTRWGIDKNNSTQESQIED
ncbi:MAG TPA: tRNA guanosine(15) transglycosylase TgtA [Methanofastidiosum sp.]|jgi:7-cyano-7-deazaguanine tRNA-ribosyltransferase|nr:tRNA guanosine(15) transglycosylase TgtA [Methanofastidiosum sp.]HNZ88056.1 tRNA guanosine(15) transglycosylase TgtA [Methanofastidiosum sp.]